MPVKRKQSSISLFFKGKMIYTATLKSAISSSKSTIP